MAVLFVERPTAESRFTPVLHAQHYVADYASTQTAQRVCAIIDAHTDAVRRVEFVHHIDNGGKREYRGAVFYVAADGPNPEPLVYAEHALLGYSGSGPDMSRNIMLYLGMSSEQFHEMNQSVAYKRNTDRSFVVLALRVRDEWRFEDVNLAHGSYPWQ